MLIVLECEQILKQKSPFNRTSLYDNPFVLYHTHSEDARNLPSGTC